MALIKCLECGREISDLAVACVGCGAPLSAPQRFGDLDGDGKVGLSDLRFAAKILAARASQAGSDTVDYAKKVFGSNSVPTNAPLPEEKASTLSDIPLSPESQRAREKFKAALASTIDLKFSEIMRGKGETDRFLTYVDGQILTASVRNIFRRAIDATPPQIEAACSLSEAILAPTATERERLMKVAVGSGGGAVGVAMVIAALASAVGWGAAPAAAVTAWFVGTSLAGPIGWAVAGLTVAGVAAYFAATSNREVNTERFLNALKASAASAVDAMWPEHEVALTAALNHGPGASTAQ